MNSEFSIFEIESKFKTIIGLTKTKSLNKNLLFSIVDFYDEILG